ncbi:MAG: DEAD/DEAH box helicase [Pseudomonadales bacterium]|nr:DEAD/DEAH box helicase [Pseudomonadales bacterium]
METSIPIDAIQDEFLTLLPHHHLIVEADTGSGKSTRLPLWIADNDPTKKVLVIEPRRIACVALATYVATLAKTKLGHDVGYAIRFDQKFNAATHILFVTPGIALRWLADNHLSDYATIMIDEFHERRWDTDLLLALLKKKNQHRLILTSATIKGQQLANYLGGKCLTSEGRIFPVTTSYISTQPQQMPSTSNLDKRIQQACEIALSQLEKTQKNHDILVFLPGKKEIQNAAQQLKALDVKGFDIDVIGLSASASPQEQQRALNQQPRRRIILSTNVAETSLTIPNIGVVIDSGMERRTHQRNGRTVLGLDAISKASADQRKGRAGRLFDGVCIRLWGEYAPLTDTTPPEILREELTELVLAAACNDISINDLDFPNALPKKSLDVATTRLLAMNAINTSGIATAHGKQLYPLPIDSLFSHLVTAMPNDSCKTAMVDLIAALSVNQSLISTPKSEQARQTLAQWESRDCDVMTLIRVIRQSNPEDIIVNEKLRNDARKLSRQIRKTLHLPALDVTSSSDKKRLNVDRQQFVEAIIKAVPELVFIRREKRRSTLGNGYGEAVISDNSRLQDNIEACIVFDQHNLPGKGLRETITIATCIAPISFSDIIHANLHTEKLGHIHWKKQHLLIQTQLMYAGRIIGNNETTPEGHLVRKAITQLILENRIFSGLNHQLQEDIGALALYQSMNQSTHQSQDTPANIPNSVEEWVLEKLQLLGVENSDDLQLIDASDLQFNGIPDWEKASFLDRFPQTVTLSDITLSVTYAVGKKQITLNKISGDRKTEPKRWELPPWQGWRIRYKKASRIVDIK